MPVRRLRALGLVCLRYSCSVSLSRSSLVRSCLVIALAVVVLPVGLPRCLLGGGDVIPAGVLIPHRFSCLSPRVLRGLRLVSCLVLVRHSSSVVRLMWLVAPSGGVFSCCSLPFACLPVSSARAGVRGGVWFVVVSLVGDLLVFLGGRRGAGVRFVSLPWDGEKK